MVRVAKYLKHWCQLTLPQLNQFTDVTSTTSVTTTACFAYFGEATKSVGGFAGRQFEQDVGWWVILPTTCHSIQTGDELKQIRDKDGLLVWEYGRVAETVVYRHPRKGVQFVQVRLNDN